MLKRLTPLGNGLALEIDRSTLDLLGITPDTMLELTTDGDRLIVQPQRGKTRTEQVADSLERLDAEHGPVFDRLAE